MVSLVLLTAVFVSACGGQEPKISGDLKAGELGTGDETEVHIDKTVETGEVKTALTEQDLSVLMPGIRRIRERGKLIVVMYEGERPPFFYTDKQGRFVGIDVELAQDIASLLDVELVLNRSPTCFGEVVKAVATGQADVAISKLSVTLARAQKVRYTQPYVLFNQTLLINRLALVDLQAKNPGRSTRELVVETVQKVGVIGGTSYVEFAKFLFPYAEVIFFAEKEKMLQAVVNGEILAILYDEFELKGLLQASPEASIYAQLLVLPDRVDPIAMAVAAQNEDFLSWLNIYLDFSKANLKIERILAEHIQ